MLLVLLHWVSSILERTTDVTDMTDMVSSEPEYLCNMKTLVLVHFTDMERIGKTGKTGNCITSRFQCLSVQVFGRGPEMKLSGFRRIEAPIQSETCFT